MKLLLFATSECLFNLIILLVFFGNSNKNCSHVDIPWYSCIDRQYLFALNSKENSASSLWKWCGTAINILWMRKLVWCEYEHQLHCRECAEMWYRFVSSDHVAARTTYTPYLWNIETTFRIRALQQRNAVMWRIHIYSAQWYVCIHQITFAPCAKWAKIK